MLKHVHLKHATLISLLYFIFRTKALGTKRGFQGPCRGSLCILRGIGSLINTLQNCYDTNHNDTRHSVSDPEGTLVILTKGNQSSEARSADSQTLVKTRPARKAELPAMHLCGHAHTAR